MKAKTLIAELRKEFFTTINESHYQISRRGHWTHHDAGRCFDEAVKSLAAKVKQAELAIKQAESFETKALRSFKALVESAESRKFMEDYYGNDK